MHLSSSTGSPAEAQADWLIVPVWEEGFTGLAAQADGLLKGKLSRLRESKDLTGKPLELLTLYGNDGFAAPNILLLGLGKRADVRRWGLTTAATAAAKYLCGKKRRAIAIALPESDGGLKPTDVILALAAGLIKGCRSPGVRLTEPNRFEPDQFVFLHPASVLATEVQQTLRRAEVEGRAVGLARDLVNEPPCDLYPQTFAERIVEAARRLNIECTVLDEKQIEKERMGCLLGVAQGSVRPPRLVILRYSKGKSGRTLGLIGKGVTFDSGGLSLKTNDQMIDMKCDMAGAAAVFAAITAIAELQVPVNVLGVMPLVENLPSGVAMKLGDVLKARNGKTVEVLNTDAEGRLILADALSYAVDQKANHLVDLATLTGSCMVALGTEVAGLMANQQPWADRVGSAIERAGERSWQLPMWADYGELIKSPVADIKNVGAGRFAGAITGAKFLEHFVGSTPWVHLDIAGPAFVAEESPIRDQGGTGCMVRSLVELGMGYDGWSG